MRTPLAQVLVIAALVASCAAVGHGLLAYVDRQQQAAEDAELDRIAVRLRMRAEHVHTPSCGRDRCILAGGQP